MASSPRDAARARDAGDATPRGWRGWPARARGDAARGGLRTQVIATLGLTPLTLVFFQQVSLVGLLANLVAIPLVTLVITPLALLGIAAARRCGRSARVRRAAARRGCWRCSRRCPGAVWTVAGRAAVGAARRPARRRAASCCRCPGAPRLLAAAARARRCSCRRCALPAEGSFELLAADVGQGTAVLVRTRRARAAFDSRPAVLARERRRPARAAAAAARARRASHRPAGAQPPRQRPRRRRARACSARSPVGALLSSLEDGHPLLGAARARASAASPASAGTGTACDFDVLHPAADDYARALRPNAMSCVLRVVGGGAQRAADRRHRARRRRRRWSPAGGAALRSDVLRRAAPRQQDVVDARPSSTPCSRAIAVFQAGYRNRFGHPARRSARALPRARHRGRRQPGVRRLAVARRRRRRRQLPARRRAPLLAPPRRRRPLALERMTASSSMARTLLPSPEAAMKARLRRDARPTDGDGARALPRLRPLARGTAAAGDAVAARRGRGDLPPRRHHLRGLWRQGRRTATRHRAADPVRPDPAHHPGARMARDGSAACASASRR